MKLSRIAAMVIVFSLAGTSLNAHAAQTTKKKVAVKKKVTTKKPVATQKPVTTRLAGTTGVPTTTINPISDQGLINGYLRFVDVDYKVTQDPTQAKKLLPTVATGDALTYWLAFYSRFAPGDRWTGTRNDIKLFDLRVLELSDRYGVLRVCRYDGPLPTVDKNGTPYPGTDTPLVDDLRLELQYVNKKVGWLLAKDLKKPGEVEGESKCADGKV
jgi:hypothetical protein